MNRRRPPAHFDARSLCSDYHSDDGPPARRRKETRDKESELRKTLQLCSQVKRALHCVIPCPGLPFQEGLLVEDVAPDPDASRLRVTVSVPAEAIHSVDAMARSLADTVGFLRSEVAASIHRKRVPMLRFELIPREEGP